MKESLWRTIHASFDFTISSSRKSKCLHCAADRESSTHTQLMNGYNWTRHDSRFEPMHEQNFVQQRWIQLELKHDVEKRHVRLTQVNLEGSGQLQIASFPKLSLERRRTNRNPAQTHMHYYSAAVHAGLRFDPVFQSADHTGYVTDMFLSLIHI